MTENELRQKLDELLDGSISDADFLLLEAEMRVNPEVRESYYRRLNLHHALTLEAQQMEVSTPVIRLSFLKRHVKFMGCVAAILLLGFVGISSWKIGKSGITGMQMDAEPLAAGYAVLSEHTDAVWADRDSLQRGDLLPEGPIKLESGLIQLELFSGVTVILEGESEFEIHSPMEMTVVNGRLHAMVPVAARGFKVSTASGDVVDLGTEFALDVSSDSAEMHVIEGEIEWHPKEEDTKLLTDGDSMRWTESGQADFVSIGEESFLSMDEIERQFLNQKQARQIRWEELSDRFANDERVLAFYPIQETEATSRQLHDAARLSLDGRIVSARRVADRWGQPGSALNFSPAGSRVRVSIPGEHRSLTFYCWARIDSLDRLYNSLFLTDGHELNEPHWQIMNDGRLFFSVKRREDDNEKKLDDKHIAFSPGFWDPSQSGKWFQIATVYDVDAKTTTHYINGKMISRDKIGDDYIVETVRIGDASIGNWNEPTRGDPQFALRNLNGAIDEFTIFSEALSAAEISDIYTKGRP